ncbi:unnamed protein product [Plutella xylostella]|uniref:(diamondback moth) hypothetical protein n=1 Tax=Plutella xylostella TaxID=51655 RepID=A0A8S4FBZ6_PLUXY|nr:unnamed protein product [Plutella xylostella]
MKLHGWARVRPAIAQINLAVCCVVPPALHAFCKENDVQLLTHIDPPAQINLAACCVVLPALHAFCKENDVQLLTHIDPPAQINRAACCVVPPALHACCKENDVQLLTHIDPPDLLSIAAVKTLSDGGVSCNALDWCARYQVHIKCRGVLALKGYVCKATLAGREVVVS